MSDSTYVCPRCKHHHTLQDEQAGEYETKCELCNFRFRFVVRITVSIDEECVNHSWQEWEDNSEITKSRFCDVCLAYEERDKEPVQ